MVERHRERRELTMRIALAVLAAPGLAACGGPAGPSSVTAAPGTTGMPGTPGAPARSDSPPRSPPSAAPRKAPPDTAAIYARLRPALVACYDQGQKSTPEMVEGKLTLNATIDAAGRTSCVIASEDTGLTQEVEDCMVARFATEKFDESAGAPWQAVVPVVVRKGAVQLGERAASQVLAETVETRNMPDAFEALESLLPELTICLHAIDRSSGPRSILVAAKIGADGRSQCALTSSFTPLPPKVGDCAAGVLQAAKFPPPKRGAGVVLVPINLTGAK